MADLDPALIEKAAREIFEFDDVLQTPAHEPWEQMFWDELSDDARAEVQVLLALSRNRRDAEWALGTGSVVAKREGREADMTETKPSTVTDRYFVARKRLERLAAKAGIPKTVSEDLIVVLSVAAAGFTERAARLAAEARAKMLEEAARSMIAAFDGYTNKPIDDGYWRALYDAKLALIAALKEPANG